MKKKLVGLLAVSLLLSGCGKVATLSNGEDAVVSFENGEMISVDDLYEKMKDTYALSTLMTMMDKYVLETTFESYIETAQEYTDSYMETLRSNYDSDDELLEAIQNYTGMSSLEAYEEQIYLNYMKEYATEEYAKFLITDKEVKNYYENDAVGDIEVSHILITPEVTDDMTDEEKEAAEETAKEKAESILKELKAASSDELETLFKKLAKENSDDDATKDDSGSLGKINKDTLSSSYDELVTAAYSIKDGAIYKEVVTTEMGYHIIYRTKSYEKDTLENLEDSIRETLAEEKYASDTTISYEAMKHYRDEMGLKIEDSELSNQYAYYMNNLLSSLTSSSDDEE